LNVSSAGRPNVLLIVYDTARADAFEPYGAPPGATPVARQLASRGQAHRAFAAAPWTIPSHAAMFSGVLPGAAGMPGPDPENMVSDARQAIPRLAGQWLPSVLSAAGYQTSGISMNGQVSGWTGFDMGFSQFSHPAGERWCRAPAGRAGRALRAWRASADDGAAGVEQMLRAWASGPRQQPFFWFVNLIECHSPYQPARPYNPLPPWNRLRAATEAQRYLQNLAMWSASCGHLSVPADALERMRRLYAGAIRLLDSWLGRVLEAFDQHHLLEETIVIVTSDHGENLGEAGLMGHVFSLDDRLIRVPFLVQGPAAAIPGPLFSLVDLPAWIAASCGIAHSPWEPPAPRHIAVAQFEAPGDPDDPRVATVSAALGLDDAARQRITERLTCVTDGTLKLLRRGDREELYDLQTDPLEQSPLPPAQAGQDRLASLRDVMSQARAQDQARPERAAAPELSAEAQASLESQMKLLGYL
jgi:arylsulfatase A-like enzyme